MLRKSALCTLIFVLFAAFAVAQDIPDAPQPKPKPEAAQFASDTPSFHHSGFVSVSELISRYAPLVVGGGIGYAGFRSGNFSCYLEDKRNGVADHFGRGSIYGGTLHPNATYFKRVGPIVAGTVFVSELLRHFQKTHLADNIVYASAGTLAGAGIPQFGNCS